MYLFYEHKKKLNIEYPAECPLTTLRYLYGPRIHVFVPKQR